MSDATVRWNAIMAVEHDEVRRRDRLSVYRLGAALLLAPTLIVAEALLEGLPVPASRLDPELVQALGLNGPVQLDYPTALRTVAHGPIPTAPSTHAHAA